VWLITPRGFYSAVAKPGDGEAFVTVRARTERDIRNLADLIDAQPERSEHTDYRWRVRCRKSDWARAVAAMAEEIDYATSRTASTSSTPIERGSSPTFGASCIGCSAMMPDPSARLLALLSDAGQTSAAASGAEGLPATPSSTRSASPAGGRRFSSPPAATLHEGHHRGWRAGDREAVPAVVSHTRTVFSASHI
jgi:hypothetical protein